MRKKRVSQAVISDVAAFIEQANPNRARPVKLQISSSGGWRDVIGFDAGKDVACGEVMAAADMLARIGKATWPHRHGQQRRAQVAHGPENWSAVDGWKEAK